MADESYDPMAGGTVIKPKSTTFKLGKPGDIVKGTIQNLEVTQGDKGAEYKLDVKVEICKYHVFRKDEAGNYIAVDEETVIPAGEMVTLYGGRKDLDTLFEESSEGDIIGIQFEKYEQGNKGAKPYKVVKTINFGKDPNFKPTASAVEEVFPGAETVTDGSDQVEGSPF